MHGGDPGNRQRVHESEASQERGPRHIAIPKISEATQERRARNIEISEEPEILGTVMGPCISAT